MCQARIVRIRAVEILTWCYRTPSTRRKLFMLTGSIIVSFLRGLTTFRS